MYVSHVGCSHATQHHYNLNSIQFNSIGFIKWRPRWSLELFSGPGYSLSLRSGHNGPQTVEDGESWWWWWGGKGCHDQQWRQDWPLYGEDNSEQQQRGHDVT